ncbi:MAG TPA: DUF3667 domain-containing protein [Mucilaginibacter sp.]|nr:DUF3667 domain-containing protein [Mucilaginibacter sp.]
MKKHYRKENDCLNCGSILQGHYCHNCGQENLELHESFGHMMNHAISDYFHFDHQFFHTLKPLLFKPGFLTNEYMAGRRAQYLHPVKMYIFISIVYFLLLFQNSHKVVTTQPGTGKPVTAEKALDSVNNKIARDKNLSAEQKKKIQKEVNKAKVVTSYGGVINVTEDADDKRGRNTWFAPTTKDTTYEQYLANQKKLPENEQDGFMTKLFNKKKIEYHREYGDRAKEVFLEELKHNTPKMMFLLLPLFALILRVAFWKNKKFYVEHLIYSFHFHCFLFLFLGIFILLQLTIPSGWGVIGWLNSLASLYVMWYIYRSLRVVYHRSAFRTITKIIGMWFMYFAAFTFCIATLFIVTAIL